MGARVSIEVKRLAQLRAGLRRLDPQAELKEIDGKFVAEVADEKPA